MQFFFLLLISSLCRLQLATAASCNNDNCLRAMSASPGSASAFCQTYTTQVVVASTGLPTFLSRCSGIPSRISSACSCIFTATKSTTSMTISTSVPTTTTTAPTTATTAPTTATTAPTTATTAQNSCTITFTKYEMSTVTSYITNIVAATTIVTSYVTTTATNSIEVTVSDDYVSTETDSFTATVASTATAVVTSYVTNTVTISVNFTVSDDFFSTETDSFTAIATSSFAESVTYYVTATVTNSFTATITDTAISNSCSVTVTTTATVTAVPSCQPGSAFCQGACLDVLTDPTNCGICGNVCPSLPNSSPTCSSGTCGFVCNPEFKDCDGNSANGCEVTILNDLQNCGGCGAACLNPINFAIESLLPFDVTCTNGLCNYICIPTETANCTGPNIYGNPCPIELQVDSANCGYCGNICGSRQNTESGFCQDGNCYSPCLLGFTDCDGNVTNGCETDTYSDVNNCGSCGNVCFSAPNGITTCAFGKCTFQCSSGFASCDGNLANGCEVNTLTDRNNCGSCGHTVSLPIPSSS